MKMTIKKTIALLLMLVQVFVLLPVGMTSVKAVESGEAASGASPALNRTIVGTVKFQSFNFLGDNATGSDGVDYTSTFYYSDDFFSPSAIHDTNSADLKWSDLTTSEMSLASMSFDFATAAYATNVGNVKTATDRTWDNTDYSDKAVNARNLLTTCGFEDFQAYDYDHAPTNDSIAYVIAHKKITVWDETSHSNKEFTLIALGVRGAGYGAEWASNVTIGNKSTNQLPANGRHWGFDNAATEICGAIQTYLSDHNITQDVKYWITGFSRAGATANLVAGYVTDGAETIYHTHQRDVYGYTWECPQAASTDEIALNYKNIHNILNAMDAVPKVSPDAFKHQRLGVDYVMPYYGNTTSSQNTTYYTNMREVLKTIAVGAYNYKGEYYTEDPLISVTDPDNYPYNRTMRVRTITATQLIGDAIDGTLAENFGTVDATGSNLKITPKHIDEFIDDLIKVFLVSKAWIGGIGGSRTELQNRTTFISDFQGDFRNVLGYLLDYSGPAFLGMVDALIDAVGDQMSLSNTVTNAGLGLAFLNFYEYPTSTYKWGVPPFIDPWVGSPSWAGQTRRAVLISEAKPVVRNVIRNMVGNSFTDPQGITRTQFENSMDKLVQLVVNLYADELSKYNSNYFGTSLYYLWQILCTHEQEVVMSWIKSLDQNHINRGYRTLTVPKGTDVKVYQCRSGCGEALGFDTTAPLVAEVKNGAFIPLNDLNGIQQQTLDDRISVSESGSDMIIRYPSLLDLRFDVTTDTSIPDLSFALSDYRTNAMATALSDGEKQYDPARSTSSNYTRFTSNGANTWNTLSNSSTIPLAPTETLSITARHTASYNENDTSSNLFYNMRKHGDTTRVIDFSAVTTVATDAQTLSGETNRNGQFLRNANSKTVTYQLNTGAQLSSGAAVLNAQLTDVDTAAVTHSSIGRLAHDESLTVVPASSVYFDDNLAGQTFTSDGHGYSSDINDEAVSKRATDVSGALYFTFYGTGIDIYCTTHDKGGYVSAGLFQCDYSKTNTLTNRITDDQNKPITVKNQSSAARYNTPTISFGNLQPDTYTVKISANANAQYKLDGVRVYNPVEANSAAAAKQAELGEDNATYLNLRALLLNDNSGFSVTKPTGSETAVADTVSGVLYIDGADTIKTKSHYAQDDTEAANWLPDEVTIYTTQFDAYEKNGPKTEIYLSNNQAITFQLNTDKVKAGTKVWVGLSAPETGSGTVTITGRTGNVDVTSVMDMYYDFTVQEGGSVTITNTSENGALISITNLKITGIPDLLESGEEAGGEDGAVIGGDGDLTEPNVMTSQEILSAKRAVLQPITLSTVRMAANDGVDPEATVEDPTDVSDPQPTAEPDPAPSEEPTATPTPSVTDIVRQLISSFVSRLFNSVSRLFAF